ncbi:hypothetical protein BESB_064860 [Besnoitia besnoiti]|uniref:Trs120/TRAPPC9 first Ig-like domain-containing protein n=1 Tax=Besnoitia besnoiti TaxID=94643 RepID=A0A2A9M8Z1_BESBE|nr:hypothetical protein BESB_064860 [Besnoitia besnoiti]PFH34455.1 hypothetical protein BESB_064860 [Besnoitia besnoiti]
MSLLPPDTDLADFSRVRILLIPTDGTPPAVFAREAAALMASFSCVSLASLPLTAHDPYLQPFLSSLALSAPPAVSPSGAAAAAAAAARDQDAKEALTGHRPRRRVLGGTPSQQLAAVTSSIHCSFQTPQYVLSDWADLHMHRQILAAIAISASPFPAFEAAAAAAAASADAHGDAEGDPEEFADAGAAAGVNGTAGPGWREGTGHTDPGGGEAQEPGGRGTGKRGRKPGEARKDVRARAAQAAANAAVAAVRREYEVFRKVLEEDYPSVLVHRLFVVPPGDAAHGEEGRHRGIAGGMDGSAEGVYDSTSFPFSSPFMATVPPQACDDQIVYLPTSASVGPARPALSSALSPLFTAAKEDFFLCLLKQLGALTLRAPDRCPPLLTPLDSPLHHEPGNWSAGGSLLSLSSGSSSSSLLAASPRGGAGAPTANTAASQSGAAPNQLQPPSGAGGAGGNPAGGSSSFSLFGTPAQSTQSPSSSPRKPPFHLGGSSSATLLRLLPARLQKQVGDALLLGGAPAAAAGVYVQAAEACRSQGDTVWQAAALEGQAAALYAFLRSALFQLDAYEKASPARTALRGRDANAGSPNAENARGLNSANNGPCPGSPGRTPSAGGPGAGAGAGGAGGVVGAGAVGGVSWASSWSGSAHASSSAAHEHAGPGVSAAGGAGTGGGKTSWWAFDGGASSGSADSGDGALASSDASLLIAFPPSVEAILTQCVHRRTYAPPPASSSGATGGGGASGGGLVVAGGALPFPAFLPGSGSGSNSTAGVSKDEKGVSSAGAYYYFSSAQGSSAATATAGGGGSGPAAGGSAGAAGPQGTGGGESASGARSLAQAPDSGGRGAPTAGAASRLSGDGLATPGSGRGAECGLHSASLNGCLPGGSDAGDRGDPSGKGPASEESDGPASDSALSERRHVWGGGRAVDDGFFCDQETEFCFPSVPPSPELLEAIVALIQSAFEAVCLKLRDAAQLYNCLPGCALLHASTSLLLCRLVARLGTKTESLQLISSAAEKAKRLEVQDFVACLASLAALCSSIGAFRKLAFLLHRVCMALLEAKKWSAAHYAAALAAPWYHLALLELPPSDHFHPLVHGKPPAAFPFAAVPSLNPTAPLLSLGSQLSCALAGCPAAGDAGSLARFVDALRQERQREARRHDAGEETCRREGAGARSSTSEDETSVPRMKRHGAARRAYKQGLAEWDLLGDLSFASAVNSPLFSFYEPSARLALPSSAAKGKPSLLSSAAAALGVGGANPKNLAPPAGLCARLPSSTGVDLARRYGRGQRLSGESSLSPEDFNFAVMLLRLRRTLRQQHYTPHSPQASPWCYAAPPPLPPSLSPLAPSVALTDPFFYLPRPPFPVSSPASLDFLGQHQRRVKFTEGGFHGGPGDKGFTFAGSSLFVPSSSVSAALGGGGLRVWWPAVQSRVLHMLKITTEHLGDPGKVAWYACAALKILYPVIDHKTQASTIMLIQAAAGRRATPLALPPALTIVSKRDAPASKLLLDSQRGAYSRTASRKRAAAGAVPAGGGPSGAGGGRSGAGASGGGRSGQDEQLQFLGGMCKGAAPPLPLLARIQPVVDASVIREKSRKHLAGGTPLPDRESRPAGARRQRARSASPSARDTSAEARKRRDKAGEDGAEEKAKTVLMYNPFSQKQDGASFRGREGKEAEELPVAGQWVKGELRTVQVSVRNPLGVELVLDKAKVMTCGAHAEVYPVTVLVPPSASHQVTFEVTVLPKEEGRLFFTGLTYTLNKLQCTQLLLHQSARLASLLDADMKNPEGLASRDPEKARASPAGSALRGAGRGEEAAGGGPEGARQAREQMSEENEGESLLEATEKALELLKFSAAASVEVVAELPLLRVSVEAYSAPSPPPPRLVPAQRNACPFFAFSPGTSRECDRSQRRGSSALGGGGESLRASTLQARNDDMLAAADANAAGERGPNWVAPPPREASEGLRGGAELHSFKAWPERAGGRAESSHHSRPGFFPDSSAIMNFSKWPAKPLWRSATGGLSRRRKLGFPWHKGTSSHSLGEGLKARGGDGSERRDFVQGSAEFGCHSASSDEHLPFAEEKSSDDEGDFDSEPLCDEDENSRLLFASADEEVELARLLFPRHSTLWAAAGPGGPAGLGRLPYPSTFSDLPPRRFSSGFSRRRLRGNSFRRDSSFLLGDELDGDDRGFSHRGQERPYLPGAPDEGRDEDSNSFSIAHLRTGIYSRSGTARQLEGGAGLIRGETEVGGRAGSFAQEYESFFHLPSEDAWASPAPRQHLGDGEGHEGAHAGVGGEDRRFSASLSPPAPLCSGDPRHSPVWEGQHRMLSLQIENVGRAPVRDLRFELLTADGEAPKDAKEEETLKRHFQVLWHPACQPTSLGPSGTVIYSEESVVEALLAGRGERELGEDDDEFVEDELAEQARAGLSRQRRLSGASTEGTEDEKCDRMPAGTDKDEERGRGWLAPPTERRCRPMGRQGRGEEEDRGQVLISPGQKVRIPLRCIASAECSSCVIRVVYSYSPGSKHHRQVLQPLSLRVQNGLQLRPHGLNIFPLVFFSHHAVLKTYSAFPALFCPGGAAYFPFLVAPSPCSLYAFPPPTDAGFGVPHGLPDASAPPLGLPPPLRGPLAASPARVWDFGGDPALSVKPLDDSVPVSPFASAAPPGTGPGARGDFGLGTEPEGGEVGARCVFAPFASRPPTHKFDHKSCLVCLDLQNAANVAFECFTSHRRGPVRDPRSRDASVCCVPANESQSRWALWVRRPRLSRETVDDAAKVVGELDKELNIRWRCFPSQEGSLKLLPLLRRAAAAHTARTSVCDFSPTGARSSQGAPAPAPKKGVRGSSPERREREEKRGRGGDAGPKAADSLDRRDEGKARRKGKEDGGSDVETKEDDEFVRLVQLPHFTAPELLIRPRIVSCRSPLSSLPAPSADPAGAPRLGRAGRARASLDSCAASSGRTSVDEGFSSLQTNFLLQSVNAGPLFGLHRQSLAVGSAGAGGARGAEGRGAGVSGWRIDGSLLMPDPRALDREPDERRRGSRSAAGRPAVLTQPSLSRPVRLGPDCYKIPLHEPVTLQVYVENRHDVPLTNCVVVVIPFVQGSTSLPDGLLWSGSLSRDLLEPLPPARVRRLDLQRLFLAQAQQARERRLAPAPQPSQAAAGACPSDGGGRPDANGAEGGEGLDIGAAGKEPLHEASRAAEKASGGNQTALGGGWRRGGDPAEGAEGREARGQEGGKQEAAGGGQQGEAEGRAKAPTKLAVDEGREAAKVTGKDRGRRCSWDPSLDLSGDELGDGFERRVGREGLYVEGLHRLERRGAILAHRVTLMACVPGMFSVAVAVLVRPDNVMYWHYQPLRLIA